MKLSLRLILSLVAGITLVTFIVANNQVRAEQRGLRADLARRGQILTESLQETIEPALQRGSPTPLRRIVERFGNRERLAGIAVYDADGNVLAASANIAQSAAVPPGVFADAKTNDHGAGDFATLGNAPMYAYALPLHRDAALSGVLVTFHDAAYIESQSAAVWRDALWHVVAQILLIVLITFLIVRSTIVGPIARLSQWMKDLRTGRAGAIPLPAPAEFLQPLTSEAAFLGQSPVPRQLRRRGCATPPTRFGRRSGCGRASAGACPVALSSSFPTASPTSTFTETRELKCRYRPAVW